ncbi:IS30 family transposase [Escherichia coli]|uniref:IS30 family transposase n=1 Tax=Escherichia coli TaxID=562 RepID=UPI0025522717|nr:IS30 family transposase [Escherichia coli]
MSRKTQRYSKEFKAEAVRTVLENQLSISEGASRLSLPEGTLGQWVTAARKGLGTPGSRTVAELESEILQLRKALNEARKSLTWDRGMELARHLEFTVSTGVKVYFCDPQSPWQRGTNENTNGLIRQYFPKKTCLAQYTQHELDLVAAQLNNRPRKTLKFKTPKEIIERGVALTD